MGSSRVEIRMTAVSTVKSLALQDNSHENLYVHLEGDRAYFTWTTLAP